MNEALRTCTHIHDTGAICKSVAARDQKYCPFHLNYRARQLRIAQARARAERFDLRLGPLEDMYSVQSALSQLAEALAADMIDPKRAQALLSVLRLASLNLRHPEKWQTNLYHSDQPVEIDVAKAHGLPRDLDLDTPPQLAFPPPAFTSSDLSSRAQAAASAAGVEGPASFDNRQPTTDNSDVDFRPDSPISPEFLELRDISNTHGADAAAVRLRQLERNRARRELRGNRERYADMAMRLNLKRAAERLAERKVAEKLTEAGISSTPAKAEPFDFDSQVAEGMKKTAASFAEIDACLAGKEVKIA
jgi:hypothetical protein